MSIKKLDKHKARSIRQSYEWRFTHRRITWNLVSFYLLMTQKWARCLIALRGVARHFRKCVHPHSFYLRINFTAWMEIFLWARWLKKSLEKLVIRLEPICTLMHRRKGWAKLDFELAIHTSWDTVQRSRANFFKIKIQKSQISLSLDAVIMYLLSQTWGFQTNHMTRSFYHLNQEWSKSSYI